MLEEKCTIVEVHRKTGKCVMRDVCKDRGWSSKKKKFIDGVNGSKKNERIPQKVTVKEKN